MRQPVRIAVLAGMVLAIGAPMNVSAQGVVVSGAITGIVGFAGSGVPTLPTLCAPVSFSFSGTAQGTAGAPPAEPFVGALGVTGSGGSICEDVTRGGGTVTVTVVSYLSFAGAAGMSCGPLTGPYFRFGPHVILQVLGPCSIGGAPPTTTGVVVVGEFLPSNPGDGLIHPITSAVFVASYAGQG